MTSYYYAGFDGHKHHGSISDPTNNVDQIFTGKTKEDLWYNVIDYVKDNYDGKATVRIAKV